jgi:preprotein translocase subunit Sss1
MIAIRKNVLVEQVFTKKISLIIANADDTKPSTDEYNNVIKLVQLGKECPTDELKIGDVLHLNNYASPLKVVTKSKTDKIITNLAIYNYEDIVGKD